MTPILRTARLELLPITAGMVEAVMLGRRRDAEELAQARMPERWPNRELIERAFALSAEAVRLDPEGRLWGARVMVLGPPGGGGIAERRVVGSIVFRGRPVADGIAEIAYGVEEGSQGRGYATEAVGACVDWALTQSPVLAVHAATFAWHRASVRVLEKVGMSPIGTREHETMGDMLLFERRQVSRPI